MPFPWDPDLQAWNLDQYNWDTEVVGTSSQVVLGTQADVGHTFAGSGSSAGMRVQLGLTCNAEQWVGLGAGMGVQLGVRADAVRYTFASASMGVVLGDQAGCTQQSFIILDANAMRVVLGCTGLGRYPWDVAIWPYPEDVWQDVNATDPVADWELVLGPESAQDWEDVNATDASGTWAGSISDPVQGDWEPVPNPGSEALV